MQQKVVFITGASSGIGRSLALRFASEGFALVLGARRMDLLNDVKSECIRLGARCETLLLDLENKESIASSAVEALHAFGRIDILVNNAGISQRGTAAETTLAVVRRMMEINFFGTIAITHYLLPEIRKNKGNIAIISSMSGLFGFPKRSAYSAGKFALHGYFETLSLEEPDISVTIACPGRIKTDISLHALSSDGSKHGKMDLGQINGIDVETCAEKIYAAVAKRKPLVIIARQEKILYWIKKISLSLFYKIARNVKQND